MKKTLILFFLVMLKVALQGQNLIQNGDFEDCDVPNCPVYDGTNCDNDPSNWDTEGKFYQLSKWKCNGGYTIQGGPCSKPDVFYKNNIDQTFTRYAGIFNQENIYYNFNTTKPITFYKLKLKYAILQSYLDYVKLGRGFQVFTTLDQPTDYGCDGNINTYGANNVYDYSIDITSTNSFKWYSIEVLKKFDEQFRYLMIRPKKVTDCYEYVCFDDISLENYCCSDYALYQNFDTIPLPKLTQRGDYIRAGYDVGCPNTKKDNVVVKTNENVTFQAGNNISLEPGFIVQPGAIFNLRIGGCDLVEPLDEGNYDINLLGYNNTAFFDCSGDWEHAFGFKSTGATSYNVKIFDRWGAKTYEKSDVIREQYTTYWDGTGINPNEGLQGQWVVILELYNCSGKSLLKKFSIIYHYVNGCLPTRKTDEMTYSNVKEFNFKLIEEFKIVPNPASNYFNVEINSDYNLTAQSFTLYNPLNQNVYSKTFEPSDRSSKISFDVNTIDFASGVYYAVLKLGDKTESRKIIISH